MAFTDSGNGRYTFRHKVAAAIALVILGDRCFYADDIILPSLGLFTLGWALVTIIGRSAIWHDRRALIAAACAVVFAGVLIEDPSLLGLALFGGALAMASLLPQAARFDDAWRWLQRLALLGICSVIGPLRDLAIWSRIPRPAQRRSWLHVVSLLALPLIGGTIFVTLFASANPLIADAFAHIRFPSWDFETLGRMILWALLFTFAWSTLRPHKVRPFLPTFDEARGGPMPGVSVASVTLSLLLFNLLFAIQNGLDIAFLWSGAPLTGGMTFARYAHQGAYPLIATALLAGLFVLVTMRPGSDTASDPRIRWLVMLWVGQNIVLVASCILRTLDYIDAYSLTRLRIAALAWMVLVAIGLLLICWRMLRGRSAAWLINANSLGALLMLTVASVADLGSIAAAWNIRHAREVGGRGSSLDLCYLRQLGPSALVSLTELAEVSPPSPFVDRLLWARQRVLEWTIDRQNGQDWNWRNHRRLLRARSTAGLGAKPTPVGYDRACDGRLYRPPALTAVGSQ